MAGNHNWPHCPTLNRMVMVQAWVAGFKYKRSLVFSNEHKNERGMGHKIRLIEMYTSMDLKFDDLFSGDCSSMFVLLNLHTITDKKLFYLITFFTISEKGIILHILALYASPVISSGNLRINIQLGI